MLRELTIRELSDTEMDMVSGGESDVIIVTGQRQSAYNSNPYAGWTGSQIAASLGLNTGSGLSHGGQGVFGQVGGGSHGSAPPPPPESDEDGMSCSEARSNYWSAAFSLAWWSVTTDRYDTSAIVSEISDDRLRAANEAAEALDIACN